MLVSHLLLNMLAEACQLRQHLPLSLGAGDHLKREIHDYAQAGAHLLRQAIPYFGIHEHGRLHTNDAYPPAILSGAFNPLHEGHVGLALAAAELLGHPVAFELAAVNVEKPPLEVDTILSRMAQFAGCYPVFASNAPTFVEKARLYPGATFVMGYDTAARVIHPRYYNDSEANMRAALEEIRLCECRFLVAGRVDHTGAFHEADELPIPAGFADLFLPIPTEYFRLDISSTALRAMNGRRPT